MNGELFLTLLSGAAILLTSVTLALWQILSAPDRPNYPTSGRFKRLAMFWFAAALAYRGLEVIVRAQAPVPTFSSPGQLASSLLMCALFVTFLVDHLRNWLPAKTWARIQQLLAIARCRPARGVVDARTSAMVNSTGAPCPSAAVVGPALVELSMQGVRVVGPGEGPEVLQ